MTCTSLMVSLTLGRPNERLLDVAARVADKLGAGVIGVACCRPIEVVCHDYAVPAGLFEADRKQAAHEIRSAEQEFRLAMANLKGWMEWRARTTVLPLAQHLAGEARSADLIMVGLESGEPSLDATREADIRDLVMRVGRPVLLVPAPAPASSFDHALVAWKDTREAQRAIVDALPFLAKATKVTVVEIAAGHEAAETRGRLAEVVAWLAHHGVKAEAKVMAPGKANAAQLDAVADELGANLIVAGAYGYSRQNTWVLGGVTSELLAGGRRCALIAH